MKENESICRSCFHSYVCEQFNEHRDSNNEKCHFFNDHFVSAADVVERKRGEWETSFDIDWDGNLVYDHFHRDCGHTYRNHLESGANFCPNCGADMREVDHEN